MRVLCAGTSARLAFERPEAILEAWIPDDLPRTFERIESALADGNYVAGFVSYELGATLVPRQVRGCADVLPLVSVGVFGEPATASADRGETFRVGPLFPCVSRDRYRADLATIVAAIAEGDVYQVNYAVPFSFAFEGDPEALYATLASDGTYPYSAFVERDAYALVSCSPELFVRRDRDRIVTKPMKGTATLERRDELLGEKNRAEHVMIVDLLRNDLHRLSASVTVETLMDVETYPNFATMTSTIGAAIDPSLSFEATLRAMFPCGSVTGAPKVAAMRTIADTERAPRGIFCGSIGYLAPDRTGIWNVAIRTATIDRHHGRGSLHVGGGIVAESTAASEWDEILTKQRFFSRLTPSYALLETILRERDGTYAYLAPHLARLRAAANDLHFDYDERALTRALHARSETGRSIVRVQLECDGTFEISERDAPDVPEPIDICWACERVNATEPLQRYKTTWRPHYDAALAAAGRRDCFDAILCNERDEVADTARANLFVRRGVQLITPPLSSGALPGILRSRLIASGAAIEHTLHRDDISPVDELYLGNSVRGLVRARLIETT